ncbi:TPA: hypothetical protein LNF46_003413 [Vibrio cholerae]|uniref:hypothetical protein n=1 Tax=Vibrio cholerae TaxID=666 RepID=UPI0030802AE7|nr:hypothetical protein [Vibrio cholerae]HBK7271811.1 hypothetical protein [Vibrio cholerae]HBK7293877.1 hypothetical protein [Vibrio cholerae]HBK7297440.1 hypothetical protein [Vibrio cholerae]
MTTVIYKNENGESLNKSSMTKRMIEIYSWIIFGLVLSGGIWLEVYFYGMTPNLLQTRYLEVILALLVMMFPILYRLIFNKLPLESIRESRRARVKIIQNEEVTSVVSGTAKGVKEFQQKLASHETPEGYIYSLVLSSKELAQSMYSRSGVYLLIGVLIAFSGLAFFYLQTSATLQAEALIGTTVLLELAPKFGILFFIEFIALFFLKQYKSAMDEFRYYESLQRSREETLAIVKLVMSTGKELDVYELIEKCGFRSATEKLNDGQSTVLLESKKLNKDETEIFSKIVDIVGKRN